MKQTKSDPVIDEIREVRHRVSARFERVVILLAGGDKRTQTNDIKTALRLARNL